MLYALDLGKPRDDGEPAGSDADRQADVFREVAAHFEMPEGAKEFARDLVALVAANREHLDETIARHARNWRVSRMAAVDRNILRMAAGELAHTDTPTAVVLDEAIELARHFGSDTSPSFVNGILDAVAKDVRERRA